MRGYKAVRSVVCLSIHKGSVMSGSSLRVKLVLVKLNDKAAQQWICSTRLWPLGGVVLLQIDKIY